MSEKIAGNTLMKVKKLEDFVAEARKSVPEIFPWDLNDYLKKGNSPVLLDIREPYEFDTMHIEGSVCIPRGILETAADSGFRDTVPWLVESRQKEIILLCRSGNRSLLAGKTLQEMGFENVRSLKTGVRGWSDFELPLVDQNGAIVSLAVSEEYFYGKTKEQ
ncbi:MAG: rhodanese-like domain-containing protein [Spirochaetia bacterium]|nr:rhodanese-like domain-containing protein [Spirochaetia bacterium]